MKQPIKIAVINAKGGTAKTTSVINLAHSLVNKGNRVLVCDLDPQASASLSLVFRSISPSIADVLLEKLPVSQAILKTTIEGLDLIPGSMMLSNFDITFAASKGRENKLLDALKGIKGYQFIIMDCPPTLGLLSLNAVTAADELIIPMVPQYLALEGLATFTDALERIKAGIGCKAEMLGILLTQVDRRSRATKEIIEVIRKHYKTVVFETEVPINTRLSEAPSFGKSIFQHDYTSSGAIAYQALAKEVLTKLNGAQ